MPAALLDALQARTGVVAVTGAGGKKTTIHRLAALHDGRVGITCTALVPPFPKRLGAAEVIAAPDALLERVAQAAGESRLVAFACPSPKRGRLGGLPPDLVAQVHRGAGFDVTYVKADGARGRWVKAPREDEPLVPAGTGVLIPVVSAQALGRPLDERIAHRVERVAAVTGCRPGATLTPALLGRLLASGDGALRGAGDATVVPLINMVDDAEREALAREAAEAALAHTQRLHRVVLTALRREDPVVAVIGR